MTADRTDLMLAAFLREEIDLLSREIPDIYNGRYTYSTCTDLPDPMRRGWARQVVLSLADQLDGGAVNRDAYVRRAGDNVINAEGSLYPIFSYMETQAFVGRALAPFVWERFVDDRDLAESMVDRLEAAVQASVRANVEAFLDSFCEPRYLSSQWDVASQRVVVGPDRGIASPSAAAALAAPAGERARGPLDVLTGREAQIAELVAQGLTNGEIAGRLGLKLPTIKSSLSRVFAKLGVQGRTELALLVARSR